MTGRTTLILTLALAGCTQAGAPSFVLFGAYFPAWMVCATCGIVAGILLRAGFVASGLAAMLPYQLFVCASGGLIVAIGVWLLWFGR